MLFLGSLASRVVTKLDSIVANFRCHVFAESTKRTYQNYLKSYRRFCELIHIPLVPLSDVNLARYVAYLSGRLQYNSIANYLSIVRLLHAEAGLVSPLDTHYTNTVLTGAKRVLGCKVSSKLPITPKILLYIFELISLHDSKQLCFWAACLVAFFSFLRKSNLFPRSAVHFDANHQISREHVIFNPTGVCLNVLKTKTIQFSERTLKIPLPRIPDSPMCPAKAIMLNFKQVPAVSSPSPLFLYLSENGAQVLTYPKFISLLKHFLQRLGYNSSLYSGHSFRRGGATFALECGIPADFIQSQGDWKSNAYKNYLDPSFTHRQTVMNKFASALQNLK